MNSWTRRVAIASATLALAGWVGVIHAGAQVQPTLEVQSPVAPGESFTVIGSNTCESTLTVSVPDLQFTTTFLPGDPGPDAPAWVLSVTVPTTTSPGTYPVVVTPASCGYPAASVTVTPPETLSLVKTVGTAPDVCATTNSISVVEGTTVYYCYTVTNNTNATLSRHTLTDDKLGAILTEVAQSLAPGARANTVALGKTVSTVATATTTNTATWTAYVLPASPSPFDDPSFSATASATVTVIPPPAAVAAAATPAFTG